MEINNGGNYRGEEERPVIDPWPRLEFTILKNKINLENVLSSDGSKRPSAVTLQGADLEYERQNPGDVAAFYLLDKLHRSNVTINEYLYTMPRLLQSAAKESGGFDKDFITVALQELDRVSARMEIPDIYRFGIPTMHSLKHRREYFSRTYGRIEAIKDFIWDDPAMAAKKQQLIQSANEGVSRRRPDYPI